MSRTAGRAMRGWGSLMRGGRGPLYSAGGDPPRSGERHAAGDRGPQGAPLYSAGCDHAHVMSRRGVLKTFTPHGAMRRGATGAGKGPRTSHPEPRKAEGKQAMPERKRVAPCKTAGGARWLLPLSPNMLLYLPFAGGGRDPPSDTHRVAYGGKRRTDAGRHSAAIPSASPLTAQSLPVKSPS